MGASQQSSGLSGHQPSSVFSRLKPPSPRSLLPKLPLLLAQPVQHMPHALISLALRRVLQKVFADSLLEGDLDFLIGKWLKIEISDTNIQWYFTCTPTRQVEIKKSGPSDVCIRGDLRSFILLAAQKEDPDTLFFQRDLIIEGDTDLGLEIKNLLDALDNEALPPELLFILRSAGEYVSVFPNASD